MATKQEKCWCDIYWAALQRGEDHGYAAALADEWQKRNPAAKCRYTSPADTGDTQGGAS